MGESLTTKEWLSVRDVSEITGWSLHQVRHRITDGFFKNTKIERTRYYVHRDEVVALTNRLGGRNA